MNLRLSGLQAAVPRSFLVLLSALVFAGCAVTQNVQQISQLESANENPTILLMPPDIRYYLVTAGGMREPHADWTEAARSNFRSAMIDYSKGIGTELIVLDDSDMTPDQVRYSKLHAAVGNSVLTHHFGGLKLPTKTGQFDWTLGNGVGAMADRQEADYGLFVFYRDEQASGGRVAISILAAAAGVYADAGREYGFASLVDLKTGDIVWFNVVGAGTGELRETDGAAAAVRTLFKDLPTNSTP
jgi:hypothetical protein